MNPVKGLLISICCIFLFSACVNMPTISTTNTRNDTFLHATERAQQVIDAINSNQPDALYSLLTEELRNAISQKEFMRRFADERSYPYLTPLYLYLDAIDLHPEGTAQVVCSVASRLPGEYYSFTLVYEHNAYYASIFEDIIDGSYRLKFNHIVTW